MEQRMNAYEKNPAAFKALFGVGIYLAKALLKGRC